MQQGSISHETSIEDSVIGIVKRGTDFSKKIYIHIVIWQFMILKNIIKIFYMVENH